MNEGSTAATVSEPLAGMFEEFLAELLGRDGGLDYRKYRTPQSVDNRLIEFRILLNQLSPEARYLLEKFDNDIHLKSMEPDTALQTLLVYCKSTLKLLKSGVIHAIGTVIPAPNFLLLTTKLPNLSDTLDKRWKEAQTSLNTGAYLCVILLTASILEALLLSRANERQSEISRARRLPRGEHGAIRPLQQWNLSELILVSIELGWLRTVPADYPLEMRKFRDLLHAWAEATNKFDVGLIEATSAWRVLNSSIDDLLKTS